MEKERKLVARARKFGSARNNSNSARSKQNSRRNGNSRSKTLSRQRLTDRNGNGRARTQLARGASTLELEESIQRYVDLYDFAPVPYVSFDWAGRIQEINLTATRLLGHNRDLLIGCPLTVHILRDDLRLFLTHLLRCRSHEYNVETELRMKSRLGQIIYARLSSRPISTAARNGAFLFQTAIIDLTEQRRADQAIRESEERFRTLFEHVPIAVYACDPTGVIKEYNQRAVDLWGTQPDRNAAAHKFCGSFKLYHPDGRFMPHEKSPMARALRGEGVQPDELEIVIDRPDGQRRHAIASPKILRDGTGKIIGGINCLYDITERKRGEEAGLRLAAVVQSSHDAIAAKDLNGIITDWNKSAERIFGYSRQEVIGKSILILIPPDRRNEEEDILRRVRRGQSLEQYETVRQRKDGSLIDVSLTISPIRDARGKIVGVSKIARDITKQKREERQVAEQARLLNSTSDAIIIRDSRNRIVYWNDGAEKLYGYTRKEATGKITHELLKTGSSQPFAEIHKTLAREGRWEGELVHYRRDGTQLTTLSRWSLDRHPNGQTRAILETNTDITDRKRDELALAKAARLQTTLYEFVQRRSAAQSLEEIYSAGLEAIVGMLQCHRASILLLDDQGVMRFVASRGLSQRYRKAVEGYSPWKSSVKNPPPIYIPDVDAAEISSELKKAIQRERIRALAFIPLVADGKLIGKFVTYYHESHVFADEELDLALTIARQLAHGIHRKQADEALRESEARMRAFVEQGTAGMARLDLEGRIVFVNQQLCKMSGYSESDLIGRHIRDLTHPNDREKTGKLFARLLRKARSYELEKRYIRKDGSIMWANVSASPVRDPQGRTQSAVAVIVDITLRKQAETELRRSKEMLEELVLQRTAALREANTELENEINRRRGLEGQILEISDREQERLAQELHDGLCQELTAIGFMARSIGIRVKNHRVLDPADMEQIASLVNSAATDARNIARALHRTDIDAASFTTALENLATREIWKTPCRVEINDGVQIRDDKAAINLYGIAREALINANKHARAREILIRFGRSRNEIVLSVSDDGVGMKNQKGRTRGMGFHIMDYRARSVGGRLELKSEKNRGTRVSCRIPQPV